MFIKYLWTILLSLQPKTQADRNDVNTLVENSILTSINYTANPCNDFYAYACGNYAEQHRTKYYQEMTSLMDFQYNQIILNIIESCHQHDYQVPDHCQSFIEKARVYLKACRSETKRNLRRYFEDIKPAAQVNWPILHKFTKPWSVVTYDVWMLLGQLQSYGLNNVLINHEISVDKNEELSITLEPAYIENNSTLPDINILEVLLMGLQVRKPKQILHNLKKSDELLLDILAHFVEETEEMQEITYKDLKLLYPKLNLDVYLQELLNITLTADTPILLKNPKYFQYLNNNMWQELQKPEWCNYLMMKFLFYLAIDSTAEFKTLDCVKDLRNKMDLAVNYLYYTESYAFKAKLYNAAVNDIFESIKERFNRLFKSNRLNLTVTQVQFLQYKLQNMRLNIGNLPADVTFHKVEKFYENLPALYKNNYYKNHLLLLKHRFLKSLHYAPIQSHFIVNDNRMGSTSGAFYVIKQNMIVLPFGSLAYPLFDAKYNDDYKYSILGFILAHEFTHAFDTTGLNFDGMGELINEEISDILENENFQKSLDCLQSQLPTNSIDERMADIVGIDVVFKIFSEKHPFEIPLNQFQYYYLNLAQFFCGKSNIQFIDHDSDAQRLNQICHEF
ncbi:membrane metallo-endopeptidase-like 1 [Lucilia sericata]|uniref:membrane metallo-endopeptidase-like 1 n=1 Tax=Lucilia sericata TaxID=13632 RepID=UPI0018A7FF6A|nr:membrane metallo-endopeptidase-like 1 [Lucilia sericata]